MNAVVHLCLKSLCSSFSFFLCSPQHLSCYPQDFLLPLASSPLSFLYSFYNYPPVSSYCTQLMTSSLFLSTFSLICFKPPFFLPPFRWYHILTRFLSSFLWHLPLSSHLDPVIHHLLFSIKSLLLERDIWDTVSVLSSFLNVLFLTPFTLLNLFSCFFSPFETKPSLACGSFYNVVCFLPLLKSFSENALHVVSGCRALTHVH